MSYAPTFPIAAGKWAPFIFFQPVAFLLRNRLLIGLIRFFLRGVVKSIIGDFLGARVWCWLM